APAAGARQAEPVARTRYRREIRGEHDESGFAAWAGLRFPGERDHVRVGVVGLDPPEAARVGVELPQSGLVAVETVEVAHEALDPGVLRRLEQVPVERALVAPLLLLGELRAHEEELLARVGPHVGVQ